MRCLYCGKPLPFLRKWLDGQFCSEAHRKSHVQEHEQLAISRLVDSNELLRRRTLARGAAREQDPPLVHRFLVLVPSFQSYSDACRVPLHQDVSLKTTLCFPRMEPARRHLSLEAAGSRDLAFAERHDHHTNSTTVGPDPESDKGWKTTATLRLPVLTPEFALVDVTQAASVDPPPAHATCVMPAMRVPEAGRILHEEYLNPYRPDGRATPSSTLCRAAILRDARMVPLNLGDFGKGNLQLNVLPSSAPIPPRHKPLVVNRPLLIGRLELAGRVSPVLRSQTSAPGSGNLALPEALPSFLLGSPGLPDARPAFRFPSEFLDWDHTFLPARSSELCWQGQQDSIPRGSAAAKLAHRVPVWLDRTVSTTTLRGFDGPQPIPVHLDPAAPTVPFVLGRLGQEPLESNDSVAPPLVVAVASEPAVEAEELCSDLAPSITVCFEGPPHHQAALAGTFPEFLQTSALPSWPAVMRLGSHEIHGLSFGSQGGLIPGGLEIKSLEGVIEPRRHAGRILTAPPALVPPSRLSLATEGRISGYGWMGEQDRVTTPWGQLQGYWSRTPVWSRRGVPVLSLLLALLLWSYDSKRGGFSTAGIQGLGGQWFTRLQENILRRAAISLADDFRAGLGDWQGEGDWADGWSYDASGFLRSGSLALYSPSQSLSDYRMEFLGQIERKSLAWVVRASDLKNYYVVKISILKPGPLPKAVIVRYPVVNGVAGEPVQRPLPLSIRGDTLYYVSMDLRGPSYSLAVQGQVVDSWSEERLKTGGIGFFSPKGEQARLRWVSVWHQYDTLGRLCAFLAPQSLQSTGRSFTQ